MNSTRSARLATALMVTAFVPISVHAGPCAADIDRVQAEADARIDAAARLLAEGARGRLSGDGQDRNRKGLLDRRALTLNTAGPTPNLQ